MNPSSIPAPAANSIRDVSNITKSPEQANQSDADEFAAHMESGPETPEPTAEGPAEGSQEIQRLVESINDLKDSLSKS